MDFLWRMWNDNESQPALPDFLQEQNINSLDSMPFNFYEFAIEKHGDPQKKVKAFEQLVSIIQKVKTPQALVKILTLLFATVFESKFDEEMMEALEEFESPQWDVHEELKVLWVKELTVCCKSYMLRMSSLRPVFSRALNKEGRGEIPLATMLSDLYLLINLINLLFPFLTGAVNTIGRYYLKTNCYFKQFYRAVNDHLLFHYEYIRFICSHIFHNFKAYELSDLQCFMKTLPEIELLCDRMEEVMLNKYFRGKGPAQKIYFKVEEAEEITYYIHQHTIYRKDSSEELNTADQELFGEYVN